MLVRVQWPSRTRPPVSVMGVYYFFKNCFLWSWCCRCTQTIYMLIYLSSLITYIISHLVVLMKTCTWLGKKTKQNLTYWEHLIRSNLPFVCSRVCVKLLFAGVAMGRCPVFKWCFIEDKTKWLSLESSGRFLQQLQETPSSALRWKAPWFRTRHPLSPVRFDTVTFYRLSIRLMEDAKAPQKASFSGVIRMNDGNFGFLRKMLLPPWCCSMKTCCAPIMRWISLFLLHPTLGWSVM